MDALANDQSFRTLLEPHRRAITAHCYRMLGSLQDAEEVAQDALLRAWQRQDEVRDPSAVRAWLYRIATNASLDRLKSHRRRGLPHLLAPPARIGVKLGPPAEESLWVEPAPDSLLDETDEGLEGPEARVSMRESIALAFITALQLLPSKQRAALLLVDVLGWKPQEAAALLETTVVSVNSLLQRARKSVEVRGGDEATEEALSLGDTALLRRYITTWESGDLDAFTALLADDVRLSMPPQPEWFAGREAVRRFLAGILETGSHEFRLVPVGANGGPAMAVYTRPLTGNAPFVATAINVLTLRGGRVAEMTRFASPELFGLFGLAMEIPGGASPRSAAAT